MGLHCNNRRDFSAIDKKLSGSKTVSTKVAARRLGISSDQLKKLHFEGRGPVATMKPPHTVYQIADLNAWLYNALRRSAGASSQRGS